MEDKITPVAGYAIFITSLTFQLERARVCFLRIEV